MDVLLEKINSLLVTVTDIQDHVSILNDEHGELVRQTTILVTKVEIFEKLLWMVTAASVAAVVASFWSVIIQKRNGKKRM